jgi:hypothetical protein
VVEEILIIKPLAMVVREAVVRVRVERHQVQELLVLHDRGMMVELAKQVHHIVAVVAVVLLLLV